jgi:hypothetical protein
MMSLSREPDGVKDQKWDNQKFAFVRLFVAHNWLPHYSHFIAVTAFMPPLSAPVEGGEAEENQEDKDLPSAVAGCIQEPCFQQLCVFDSSAWRAWPLKCRATVVTSRRASRGGTVRRIKIEPSPWSRACLEPRMF